MKLIQPVKRFAAFTLIELIVVVGVVSMLLLLLFSPHPHQRLRSQTATCIKNLKQVGIALSFYAVDHSELFPWQRFSIANDTNSSPKVSADSQLPWQYVNRIFTHPYGSDWSGVNKYLVCPSDKERKPASFPKERIKSNQGTSYFIGLNESNASEDVVALGDRNLSPGKGQPLYSSSNGKSVNIDANTTVWGTTKSNQFHGDYGSLLFTDGHVESIKALPAILTEALKAGGTNANRFLFPQ